MLAVMAAAAVFAAPERPWSLIDIQNRTIADEKAQILEESTFGARSKWNITRTVHGPHAEKAKILKLVTWNRKGDSLLIRIGDGVKNYKSRTGARQMVSSGVTRYFSLPAAAAGKILTARFKSAVKGTSQALIIAGGIALQNIPEGMVIIGPMLAAGVSERRTFICALVTGLIEVIGTFIGYFAVSIASAVLPFALAFAGGTMLYVISDEMIPETHAHGNERGATYALLVGFCVMLLTDVLLG